MKSIRRNTIAQTTGDRILIESLSTNTSRRLAIIIEKRTHIHDTTTKWQIKAMPKMANKNTATKMTIEHLIHKRSYIEEERINNE